MADLSVFDSSKRLCTTFDCGMPLSVLILAMAASVLPESDMCAVVHASQVDFRMVSP